MLAKEPQTQPERPKSKKGNESLQEAGQENNSDPPPDLEGKTTLPTQKKLDSSYQIEMPEGPTFHEEILGDSVAINFEPPGRYLVETEVNFMTASMSLSMRRTVRARSSPQQRPLVDPESALALIKTPCVNYRVKAKEILRVIRKDPEISDLKITFYMVACENKGALKPFPTSIVEESDIGQESLSLVNEEIPSIKLLKIILGNLAEPKTSDPIIAILHWLLVVLNEPKLKLLPSETFHSIFQKVERGVNFQLPSYVFKLMVTRSSPIETSWQAKKGNRKSFYAFYTDSLEKMHSIIHIGFYPSLLNYKDQSGPGVFFYTDLKYCLENTTVPSGWGWGKSELGVQMKVVLVAEFLEDRNTKYFNDCRFSNEIKALTSGEPHGEEELYCYFVQRTDEIRIRYILLFVQSDAKALPCIVPVRRRTIFTWCKEHKTPLIIAGAVFLTLALKHFSYIQSFLSGFKSKIFKPANYSMKIKS